MMCMKTVKSKLPILFIMAAGIGLFGMVSCSKSSSGGGGPTGPVLIGGYASSDSVAASNLIAYWSFDNTMTEKVSSLSATDSGTVTYATTGVRGQAYQGDSGVYATYTPGSAFGALQSFTISFWYKLPANQTQLTKTQGVFFLEGSTQQNLLMVEIEPYAAVSLDSVRIHPGFNDIGGPAYQLFVPETFDTLAVNKWVFFTVSYNGGTSTYTTYEDANPTGANTAFTSGQYITPDLMYTDGTMATPLGNLSFASGLPTKIDLATWPDGLFGQSASSNSFLGQLDELRVFNKALTQLEVTGLFLNGQAGR